jgi:6-phosphogluconate dehydrogenase
MGENLALNLESKGFSVAVYNRTTERTRKFGERTKKENILLCYSVEEFVGSLEKPRKIWLMVKAGPAVDEVAKLLAPNLSEGDILMDGGNSHFRDTERRCSEYAIRGLRFVGLGVSGGEEGALKGPCLMAGGDKSAYDETESILKKIAAQTKNGPCCAYLGPKGAGHYVKMVHNGIEYGILQVIAEAYDILTRAVKFDVSQVRKVFKKWNGGELNSFLMEIAVEVLGKTDSSSGVPLVSLVVDRAGQKGTGKWASQNAMDLGIPVPTIDAAVSARNLSALKEERTLASKVLKNKRTKRPSIRRNPVQALEGAVRASVIVSYAQGFHLMRAGSKEYAYDIPLVEAARIWQGGCIIRAKLLDTIKKAFQKNGQLQNLLLDSRTAKTMISLEGDWRKAVKAAKDVAVPTPAITASLDYFDGYKSARLPANLIQALRDRFGAHGYERFDKPGVFHSDWYNYLRA